VEDNEKKLAWVVDKDGNAHVNSETLLIREIDSLMRDEDVSSSLLSSFENVFVDSLTDVGYVPKDEYRNILRLAARSHVLRLFGDETPPVEALGDDGVMRRFLADALTRSVQSLVDAARRIGRSREPEAAAIRWVKGRLAKTRYARFVSRM
jgi:hypothetical protein